MFPNLHPTRRAAREARMAMMERRYKTHRKPIPGLRRGLRRRFTPIKKFLRECGGYTRFRSRVKLILARMGRKRTTRPRRCIRRRAAAALGGA